MAVAAGVQAVMAGAAGGLMVAGAPARKMPPHLAVPCGCAAGKRARVCHNTVARQHVHALCAHSQVRALLASAESADAIVTSLPDMLDAAMLTRTLSTLRDSLKGQDPVAVLQTKPEVRRGACRL